MTLLEAYYPILIDSQREYLRAMFDPMAPPDLRPSRRERLGVALVRLGERIAGIRPASLGETLPEIAPTGLTRA